MRGAFGVLRLIGCSRRPIFDELLRRRSRLEVVEGIVRDVAFKGGRAYVNFGSDRRRDFTAVVPPRLVRGSPERSRASRHSSARA